MKPKSLVQKVLNHTGLSFEALSKKLDITPSYLKQLDIGKTMISPIMKERLINLLEEQSYKKEVKNAIDLKSKEGKDIIQFLNDEEDSLVKDSLVDEE